MFLSHFLRKDRKHETTEVAALLHQHVRTTRWWNYSSERRKEKEEEKIKIESGRGTHDSNKGVGERKGGKTGGLVTRDVNIRLCDYAFDEHGEGTTVFIRQRPRIPFTGLYRPR